MSKCHQNKFQTRAVTLPTFRPALLAVAVGTALVAPAAIAFNSGSTGADGALTPTVNTEIQLPASGILNYTSINIPTGVTVRFKANALNTPVYLLVSGNATVGGIIDISGTNGTATGTAGDGNQADDGIPGQGGPGGYSGGRGGLEERFVGRIRGGAGLGPGGGKGGIEGATGCSNGRFYKYIGGGAGHLTNGTEVQSVNICGFNPPFAVGLAYGSSILQPLVGGSGGGGGVGGVNYGGAGGGGGGGAILLAVSGTLNLTGAIYANGGGGGLNEGVGAGAYGSGGSGGAVRLVATTFSGAGAVKAMGGCVNYPPGSYVKNVYYNSVYIGDDYSSQYYTCHHYGASEGRIRIEAETLTFNGPVNPGYTTDTPGPVFLSSLPSLRIATIAGSAVPLNPTGNADLTFPANIANPVTVALATTNVPTGNTVIVKVIPAYGDVQEVLSPAISGSAASGTASVQVNLPQGPSTLQAVTTYTVVVAMGEALSRFAQNERVDKVQLIASMGGENQAKLITISGKEYIVPVSVLQMVGFAG